LLAFAGLMVTAAIGMLWHRAEGGTEVSSGPLVWVRLGLAGIGIGFLTGLLGVGGGFIIVPVLVLVLGLPMPAAIGTSLVIISLNAAVSLAARHGHGTFDWAVVAPFTVAAVAGALTGEQFSDRIPARALSRAFAVLLLIVAAYVTIRSVLALT
ncbi:MAG: sulfite exporter TauE/SafE family protein, partial [Mycobacteriales bacterium]